MTDKVNNALCSLRLKRIGEFNPITREYEIVKSPTTREIVETISSPTVTSLAKLKTEVSKLI